MSQQIAIVNPSCGGGGGWDDPQRFLSNNSAYNIPNKFNRQEIREKSRKSYCPQNVWEGEAES